MIKTYTKKDDLVLAVKYDGGNIEEVTEICGKVYVSVCEGVDKELLVMLTDRDGNDSMSLRVKVGDWVWASVDQSDTCAGTEKDFFDRYYW